MMVYLIDSRVPAAPPPASVDALMRHDDDLEQGWRRVIRAFPGHEDAQVVMAGSEDPIPDLVERVMDAVRTLHTIWLFRILAHGDPGVVYLGRGLRVPEARQFAPLANYMTPNGRGVEIHGCNVTANRAGERLVQTLANAVQMPVTASPDVQGADNRFQFERRVVTMQPRTRRAPAR